MKVLHILDEIKYSGAEVMLKNAGPLFTSNGLDSHILSTGKEIGQYAAKIEDAGYKIHHIPFQKSFHYLFKLHNFLRTENFDVVHIHPERGFFWHALMARFAGVKIVIRTIHNVFLFTGILRLRKMILRMLANKALRVKFVAISPSVSEIEKKVFGNNTLLIANWIDHSRFRPACNFDERAKYREKFGLPEDAFVIVSVGACSEVKNHPAIIDAIALVHREIDKIRYLHVGEGPLLTYEKGLVQKNNISDITHFLGEIDDVRPALVASDIFIITSRYEGLGMVVVEAMSCGLPVVAYPNYGIRDLIKDGENGLLVQSNHHALAQAVKKLISDEDLRKKLGAHACDYVRDKYDKTTQTKELIKLYHQ